MITADKVKNQIQSLIDTANEKTGKEDVDLTSAVGSLVDGFGGSGVDIALLIEEVKFSAVALERHYENMVLNLLNATSLTSMFDNKPFMFEKLTVNISEKCTTFQNAFRGSSVPNPLQHNLKIIEINGTTRNVITFLGAFRGRNETEEIIGELDFSSCSVFIYAFDDCKALKEIRIAKNTLKITVSFANSPDLSDLSIQSIIDGLADLTGGTAQVLTVHKDVRAKIESNPEQLATIIEKNWTLASA